MSTVRLTMAQALVRYLIAQRVEAEGGEAPMFAGVFAIFGHGNVARDWVRPYTQWRRPCRPIAPTTSRRWRMRQSRSRRRTEDAA